VRRLGGEVVLGRQGELAAGGAAEAALAPEPAELAELQAAAVRQTPRIAPASAARRRL
jgi:hypothetical protein